MAKACNLETQYILIGYPQLWLILSKSFDKSTRQISDSDRVFKAITGGSRENIVCLCLLTKKNIKTVE